MVVDGDAAFRQSTVEALRRAGYSVAGAESGADALALFSQLPSDLVIVGMALVDGSGLHVLERLRERDPGQEIILVGNAEQDSASALALRHGVSGFWSKPVEGDALMLDVQRSLERASLRHERERLLGENLEFARHQSLQQRCLEFLANPDLEWLQEQILAELASWCDAQSAALWLADERGELHLRAYRGLLDKRFLPERLSPDGTLQTRLAQSAPWLAGDERARVLFVPLVNGGETLGLCQLSDPLPGHFHAETLKGAKTLGDFGAVGVKNGKRFLALQRLGLRDKETAAYNLSYFTDYAGKEIYKARRYARTFSLLTFSIDNLPQLKLRFGAADARKATRGIIRALQRIIRDSDVIAKASEHEFYLLLPETDFFGALMFNRRAHATIREQPEIQEIEAKLPLALVGGAGTFPRDGEDFDELVHRCRRRMDEQRASLERKLVLEGLDFWEEVEVLLGSAQSPRLPSDERAEPSRRGKVSETLFDSLQAEIARELLRDPHARGLLYLGVAEVRAELPLAAGLETAPAEMGSRVYVLGRRADLESHPALTPVFLEGDERLARHEFLFWLSETSAYALIQRRGKGATWGFHSSDTAVVDSLIMKLQTAYDLQPY